MIDLPLKFPSQEQVVMEEVARFRTLCPAKRVACIRQLIAAGAFMSRISPQSEFHLNYATRQELHSRRAIQEFLKRHAH